MRLAWIARWIGPGLGAVLLGGCGGHRSSPHTVTVQLDVTSSGAPVNWNGSVDGDNTVSVEGTTPSSLQVRIHVTPGSGCDVLSCPPSTTIAALVTAFGSGPGNTVTAPTITVCLKDLENGERACNAGNGAVVVSVSS